MKIGPYKCRYCKISYDTHQHRAQHETNGHKKEYKVRKEMRDPVVFCPECDHSYQTIGTLQRHALVHHGIKATELNNILEHEKETDDQPIVRKRDAKKHSKRVKRQNPYAGNSSDASAGEDGPQSKKVDKKKDILRESLAGLESIYMVPSPIEKEEVIEMEDETTQCSLVKKPDQSSAKVSTSKVKTSTPSKGKFITYTVPVSPVSEEVIEMADETISLPTVQQSDQSNVHASSSKIKASITSKGKYLTYTTPTNEEVIEMIDETTPPQAVQQSDPSKDQTLTSKNRATTPSRGNYVMYNTPVSQKEKSLRKFSTIYQFTERTNTHTNHITSREHDHW